MDAYEPPAPIQPPSLSLGKFLEVTHPGVTVEVNQAWKISPGSGGKSKELLTPDIRLHCSHENCDGIRTFRCETDSPVVSPSTNRLAYIIYRCSDCRSRKKTYSLSVVINPDDGSGKIFKFGELPPFGTPAPSKLLRLFGKDSATFLKGRQCENQALGIGAFAYYRRVVESHKNDIFDGILSVCHVVQAPPEMVKEIQRARSEISFTKGIDAIKPALPEGLLINGQNPLSLLHSALSIGLHNESDDECLQAAQDIRIVLGELVERMAALKKDDAELAASVQRLMAKKTKGI